MTLALEGLFETFEAAWSSSCDDEAQAIAMNMCMTIIGSSDNEEQGYEEDLTGYKRR